MRYLTIFLSAFSDVRHLISATIPICPHVDIAFRLEIPGIQNLTTDESLTPGPADLP
jgi:hypothetical protein